MNNKKTVFQGLYITVIREARTLPGRGRITVELIKHLGAVLIVPFLTKDKIIVLRQYRPAINTFLYELPAGTLRKEESALVCARRELKEESGYSAGRITKIGVVYPVPGYSTEKIIIYKAEKLRKTAVSLEPDEVIEQLVMSRARIRRLFRAGKILDAKTISALALCGWIC